MTGAALLAVAVVTVLVLGPYLLQATAVALVIAARVAGFAVSLFVWLGWLLVQPRQALEGLRAGIAAAEAESAIRRLNGMT